MLGHLFRKGEEERSSFNLSQYAALWNGTLTSVYSPLPVTVQRALTHAASSACIDVLASSTSATPLDVLTRSGRGRVPVVPTPPLIEEPSVLVEQDVWKYQLVESMLTDGNGFGVITDQDRFGRPTSVELIDAATVQNRRVVDGVPQVLVASSPRLLYPHGDIWHVPGKFVRAGSPFAESPVARAAATIGSALAAREFGSRFFADGAHPGGLISSEQDLSPEQAKAVKAAFMNAANGNREPAVLGAGLSYEPLIVDPNDSQFIDLMRFGIEEACRFWRVPPAMVYAATSGQSVTYANVSQADLHYLKHSLEWLFVRLERALGRLLDRSMVVRFNRNAFLRSDATTRGDYMDKRLANKTMSINEYRAFEDEPPINDPAFDAPGVPCEDDGARKLSIAEAVQKVYLGVDKVITSDEARVIVNEAGGDLPLPGPVFGPPSPGDE